MKKRITLLTIFYALTLVFTTFSGLSVMAASEADALLDAPTAAQWTVPTPPSGMSATVTDRAEGGVKIKFDNGQNQLSAATETRINSVKKVKWDGLHIRVENPNSQIAFHLTDDVTKKHCGGGNTGTLCFVAYNNGAVKLFDGGWMDNPLLYSEGEAPDTSSVIDIKFRKIDGGHMEITVNGKVNDLTANKSALELAALPDEVYVSLLNGFNEMPATVEYDMTVFHGGEDTCYADEVLTMDDLDPDMYAPELDVDTFTPNNAEKFEVTAADNGGLNIKVKNNAIYSDYLTSTKKYGFDGLHMRIENIQFDQISNHIGIWFSGSTGHTWIYPDFVNCQGYWLDLNLCAGGTGDMQVCSLLQDSVTTMGQVISGGNAIAGATTLDIKGDIVKAGPNNVDCYALIVNGVVYPLVEVSVVDGWKEAHPDWNLNYENVYIGFNPDFQMKPDGSGWFEYARNYSFDLTVLHGGDETCLAEVPSVMVEKVEELERELAAIAAITDVTLEHEAKIVAARAAYNGLNAIQKALFDDTNLAALTAAEDEIAALKEAADAADKKAIDDVIALIDALPEEIALKDEAAIVAAETAYAALTAEQKAEVTNYIDLTFARMALNALKESGEKPTDEEPTNGKPANEKPANESPATGGSAVPVIIVGVLAVLLVGVLMVSRKKARG